MAAKERIGVYPGTFDPITLGHLDIIRRGAHLVDRLVIGVTTNPSKEPMFTVAERMEMVRREVADVPGVSVVEFDSLLMDFAEREGASLILRGLRAVADFEYEYQMAGMNQQLNDRIETVFLMADVSLQPIASRLVKEIARYGGAIDKFVTPAVAADVADKLANSAGVGGAAAIVGQRSGGWGVEDDQEFGCVAFSGVGADRREGRAAARAKPPVSLVAPAEVAADPANRWTLELSNGGKVVIQLRPDIAPQHVYRIQQLTAPGLLQRPGLSPRDPRLHGPGRRSEGHRRGRLDASRPAGRVQRPAARARRRVDGARRERQQRQQPVLHHARADASSSTTNIARSAG